VSQSEKPWVVSTCRYEASPMRLSTSLSSGIAADVMRASSWASMLLLPATI
jgi:hypothetical protein